MHPSTISSPGSLPVDEDLAEQARPGYGIPSQDPRPGAQTALEPEEADREAHSVLVGGGMMAGAAAGAAVGVAVAGPVGVVVGGTLGGIAGALGGAAAGTAVKTEDAGEAAKATSGSGVRKDGSRS
ncbi:hypothetical protein ASE52_11700 [Acidovorax sp. Root275]|uniref:hypothetical protein n=1 Tax=Acidovorax sp. Root275 TaxID=1736508 RepID=UPI00070CD6CB|nr:hypothetical protein [Acidovorax sp. Root275]KRD48059.1 hypothetical protein ASE52_11700 [Acidovorax sp. Root275]